MTTNFHSFLNSDKFNIFKYKFPNIDFTNPVEKNHLIKDRKYLMVYTIYCWDDIYNNDHDCRLDFGFDTVVFNDIIVKKNKKVILNDTIVENDRIFYKFVYENEKIDRDNELFILDEYVYDKEQKKEDIDNFFYEIYGDFDIK